MKYGITRFPGAVAAAGIALFGFLSGCATVPPPKEEPPPVREPAPPPPEEDIFLPPPLTPSRDAVPFRELQERSRTAAREHEAKGELRKALLLWTVVHRFRPDDVEAEARVKALGELLGSEAERHYRRGMELRQSGEIQAARERFLEALSKNPNHEGALENLRGRLNATTETDYETKEGDTLRKVAREVYKDQDKAFLVAEFAPPEAVDGSEGLRPGKVLRLPSIESAGSARSSRSEYTIAKARVHLKAGRYDKAILVAEKLMEYDPSNAEAGEVRNIACYDAGQALIRKNDQRGALRMFRKVDPSFRNVRDTVAGLERNLRGEAESHYNRGVRHFFAGEINDAIREWETTLALDPENEKAKRDLTKARQMKGTSEKGR